MRAITISLDAFFSIMIFMLLVFFLSSVWNMLIADMDNEMDDITYLRVQQTLTLIMNRNSVNHQINGGSLDQFISFADSNYTKAKQDLGMEEFDFKFLMKDLGNTIIKQTSRNPTGLQVYRSVRRGYMDNKLVTLEVWVWK